MYLGKSVTQFEGDTNAKIIVISSVPSWEGTPLGEVAKEYTLNVAASCGIRNSDICFRVIASNIPPGRKWKAYDSIQRSTDERHFIDCLRASPMANLLVPLDSAALQCLTKHSSIDNWQLSIIPAEKASNQKTIPIYHPERVFADYSLYPFFRLGWQRIAEEIKFPEIKRTARIFHINPTFKQAMDFITEAIFADYLSIDIETAKNQMTCVGFSMKPSEAMCIPVQPDKWTTEEFHAIWRQIGDALNGKAKKVFQNYAYDCSYFNRYGFEVRNLWHDTMLAQKFLFPELPMGLDTIARIWTREPYWKDEGKDWKVVRDWNQFQIYNCKDVSVTLEAAHEQRKSLVQRKIEGAFDSLVMDLACPAAEMSWRGLPISVEKRNLLRTDVQASIADAQSRLDALVVPVLGKPINSRSPKQVKDFFHAKKYRLPVKKGKETTDQTALMKLLLRYPSDESLRLLLELSGKNKLVSSYLKPEPYPDGRFRFSFNTHGTETGRWSCKKDSWGNGINAQTISSELKKIFVAPPGWLWLEVDLKQADARFVAWDAAEPTLMKFFTENRDIHRFVASRPELFNKLESEITKDERQLGKKVGHASNYGMHGARLSEICLLEMGMQISGPRADQMLQGYHRIFPGIRSWQQRIENEIRRTKKLTTPMGRERTFYQRLGDDLFRVAYAYRPQSTVVDVINCLIKHVDKYRNPEKLHHALQAHDAAIFLVEESYFDEAKKIVFAENEWNPKLSLPGGILQIPVEAKAGPIWGEAKEIHP